MMPNILVSDAVTCLSNGSLGTIDLHPHFRIRSIQRHIQDQWIFDCLLNEEIVGILKQSNDKFRLYYEHPINPNNHDLIIVVVIDDLNAKDITVITSYKQKIEKRIRTR